MIALVEDNPDIYFATSESLSRWNAKCLTLWRPTRGTANVGSRHPGPALSDLKLPIERTAIYVFLEFDHHVDSKTPKIGVSGKPLAASDGATGDL